MARGRGGYLRPNRAVNVAPSGPIDVNIVGGGDISFDVDSIDIPKMRFVDRCMCDDVNGDGSNIVNYVETYCHEVNPDGSANITLFGTFTNASQGIAYDPVNGVECDSIGVDAQTEQNSIVVDNGASWSPTQLMCSYVIRVSALATGVTFTGSNGVTRNLELSEGLSFNSGDEPFDVSPVLTTGAGDTVIITYTTIGA